MNCDSKSELVNIAILREAVEVGISTPKKYGNIINISYGVTDGHMYVFSIIHYISQIAS